jgi:hypothetical protein
MVARAASATVSNVVGMISTEAGLSGQTAMVRLLNRRSADKRPTVSRHCLLSVNIDQLDKADAPLIP